MRILVRFWLTGCTGKVRVFQHGDFGGWQASFSKGVYDHGQFVAAGAKNDDASSLKVPEGCKATLYEHGFIGVTSVVV